MVIFNSYVKLPEGNGVKSETQLVPIPHGVAILEVEPVESRGIKTQKKKVDLLAKTGTSFSFEAGKRSVQRFQGR